MTRLRSATHLQIVVTIGVNTQVHHDKGMTKVQMLGNFSLYLLTNGSYPREELPTVRYINWLKWWRRNQFQRREKELCLFKILFLYSDAYLELAGGSLDPLPREDGPARGQQVADHRVRGTLRDIAHKYRHRRTWRHVLDNNRTAFKTTKTVRTVRCSTAWGGCNKETNMDSVDLDPPVNGWTNRKQIQDITGIELIGDFESGSPWNRIQEDKKYP